MQEVNSANNSPVSALGIPAIPAVQNSRIVTTSWDDGDMLDLRVAEMLGTRGLTGTFYVPLRGINGGETLGSRDLRSLVSQGFEVGAHGVTHATLTRCRAEELVHEVGTCKKKLQDTLGEQVRMFCYPKGMHNSHVTECVKAAGYVGARTTQLLAHTIRFDPFTMPTTVQAYRHPKADYLRNLTRRKNLSGAFEYIARVRGSSTWIDLGKTYFEKVLSRQQLGKYPVRFFRPDGS